MKSKSNVLFLMLTLLVFAGLGINVLITQANPLDPQGTFIEVDTSIDSLLGDDCTLRAAIQSANTDSAIQGCPAGNGRDTIILGFDTYSLTITNTLILPNVEYQDENSATTGDLDITDDLVILGNGSLGTYITANNIDRVFHVDPDETGISVKMYDLTIQDGKADEDDNKGGGGILTSGSLFMNGVFVTNSKAQRGGGVRVSKSGNLEIFDSIIKENSASSQGGGIYGDAPIYLDTVEILGNEAPRGGGIYCDLNCTLIDVSISKNEAMTGEGFGGGVYIDYTTELTNVTIDDNRANNQGGGIYSEAEIILTNVTISGNFSSTGGSAIFLDAPGHLTNVTIAENLSLPGDWPGVVSELDGSLFLVNTIIADNVDSKGVVTNCSGDFRSYGNNISNDDTCDLTHDSDLINTNPGLGALDENGGKTKTHPLKSNSKAIDAGNNDFCAASDQRNFPRPIDGDLDGEADCDIGAFERIPAGVLRFQTLEYAVGEDVGSLSVPITRSDGAYGAVRVYYMTAERVAPNKAHRDADYVHKFGEISWADGDTSTKYVNISIVNDQSGEDSEIFDIVLVDPKGGVVITDPGRKAFITILDNDPPPAPTATPVPDPELVNMPIISDQ